MRAQVAALRGAAAEPCGREMPVVSHYNGPRCWLRPRSLSPTRERYRARLLLPRSHNANGMEPNGSLVLRNSLQNGALAPKKTFWALHLISYLVA